VRAAAQLHVLDGRRSTARERDHVVQIEKCAFGAPAFAAHERALRFVARPDRSFHGSRHGARP